MLGNSRKRVGRESESVESRNLFGRARPRRKEGNYFGGHEVRVWPAWRSFVVDRRGADAGFIAILAGRSLRCRPEPAELRQTIRARLSRNPGLGQNSAGTELAR